MKKKKPHLKTALSDVERREIKGKTVDVKEREMKSFPVSLLYIELYLTDSSL